MSAGKFTPGKWEIYPKDFQTSKDTFASLCVGVNGDAIVRITEFAHYHATPEQIANAKLISSAPNLLRALVQLHHDIQNRSSMNLLQDSMMQAQEAIQLATE